MMKKRIPVICMLLLLLAGLSVVLYPTVSSLVNAHNQTRAIQTYRELVDEMDAEEMALQWELARQYNRMFGSGAGPGKVEVPPEYGNVLNPGGAGVMGYIEIPAIGAYLPIRHGTSEEVLQRGVGHVPQTALPIGGAGIHPVLTGHRAMASSEMFNNLVELEEGDVFLLHILDETLAYRVDRITVVEPDDIQNLLPVPGEDHVSLVTCTPYGINSHRLLVRGVRVPYEPELPIDARATQGGETDWQRIVLLAFLALWTAILLGLWISGRRRKRPRHPRRRGMLLLIGLLALTGVLVLLYPVLSGLLYQRDADRVIGEFERWRTETAEEEMDPLLRRIRAYNRQLFEGGQEQGLKDPFAFEQDNSDLLELGWREEVFGYISIQRMDIRLPIYLGASQENMNRGAAHMTHTPIPVGGENTNACIIGHRNLTRAEMFRNIDTLETGDLIILSNPWEDLTYKVVETRVIEPEESELLYIQPGRDLLTLVSCHPRGSSAKRYVVYCERTTEELETQE